MMLHTFPRAVAADVSFGAEAPEAVPHPQPCRKGSGYHSKVANLKTLHFFPLSKGIVSANLHKGLLTLLCPLMSWGRT